MVRLTGKLSLSRRAELVSVAIGLEELWVAVKSESNSVIADCPRNIFRYSAHSWLSGVELLMH